MFLDVSGVILKVNLRKMLKKVSENYTNFSLDSETL